MAIALPRPTSASFREGLSDVDRDTSGRLGAQDVETLTGRWRSSELTLHTGRGEITVHLQGDEPVWLRPALDRFSEILQLPENWNSYGARRIELTSVAYALGVLSETMLVATPAPSIVPTSPGGVQLEWHMRGIDLEVEVSPAGRVTAAWEDAVDRSEWEDELGPSFERLASALAELSRRT